MVNNELKLIAQNRPNSYIKDDYRLDNTEKCATPVDTNSTSVVTDVVCMLVSIKPICAHWALVIGVGSINNS